MKVSNVKVMLTEQDIMSIIKDYLDIKGLTIDSIDIKEMITVTGSYKNRINIPFEAKIGFGNIQGNTINLKIFSVNVFKFGIFSSAKNLAMKKFLSEYSHLGIEVDKDTITLNLDLLVKLVPYFYFKLKKINIVKGAVEVEVDDVIYGEKKEVIKIEKNKKEYIKDIPSDEYSKVRDKIVDNVPDKYEKIVEYAMLIPDITALLWRLLKDKRVKSIVKVKITGVMAYLVSPIDIFPDFIPLVGKIDDVAIAFFALDSIINEVPEEIIMENWSGDKNIILLTKEAVSYISAFVGVRNVEKLINLIKKIFERKEKDIKDVDRSKDTKDSNYIKDMEDIKVKDIRIKDIKVKEIKVKDVKNLEDEGIKDIYD